MVHTVEEWQTIFRAHAGWSVEEIAARVLKDIVHWREGVWADEDVEQLANALIAFLYRAEASRESQQARRSEPTDQAGPLSN